MERTLESQIVEGEIALVIDYQAGKSVAVDVLQGAMRLIEAMDRLDEALLSSVDTTLEPVSILNDVQHSSLKMLLARALRGIPDEHLGNLEWKKWAGNLLVKGKYRLLQKLDADAPDIRQALVDLEPEYSSIPQGLIGYTPPVVADVQAALGEVARARASLPGQRVTIQTEMGDISLPDVRGEDEPLTDVEPQTSVTNSGTEFFKIKSVDMLGKSQWTVMRGTRAVRVDILHQKWLEAYQERKFVLLPGDSLECQFEETIRYDQNHNEIDRSLAVIEVIRIVTPPSQQNLI